MNKIVNITWSRRLDKKNPDGTKHSNSQPPFLEILSLLPIAYRVNNYINNEINNNRVPIFDLTNITLQPPKPGPYGGVPLGGIGGGSIGISYNGDFRRWSLYPGKYIHSIVRANLISIRVKRNTNIYSTVLSTQYNNNTSNNNFYNSTTKRYSTLSNWNWHLDSSCATYYALFPFAFTIYKDPLPNITVIIKQLSPFIPHSYSDASLPVGIFEVEVINTSQIEGAEISVMFSYQNGVTEEDSERDGLIHTDFEYSIDNISNNNNSNDNIGVSSTVVTSESSKADDLQSTSINNNNNNSNHNNSNKQLVKGVCMTHRDIHNDQGSYAIAATINNNSNESSNQSIISYCTEFVTEYDGSYNKHTFSMCKSNTAINKNIFKTVQKNNNDNNQMNRNSSSSLNNTTSSNSEILSEGASLLWKMFHRDGSIGEVMSSSAGTGLLAGVGRKVGGAVCVKTYLLPATATDASHSLSYSISNLLGSNSSSGNSTAVSFALSWDHPIVRFGPKPSSNNNKSSINTTASEPLPRYYTKFTTMSGFSAPLIAVYALTHMDEWKKRIVAWQKKTLEKSDLCHKKLHDNSSNNNNQTIGIDSETATLLSNTAANSNNNNNNNNCYNHMLFNELYYLVDGGTIWTNTSYGKPNNYLNNLDIDLNEFHINSNEIIDSKRLRLIINKILNNNIINKMKIIMNNNDCLARNSNGNQSIIGQFLYLEGHEYLMYNTYDVHFYSGFSLLINWPQLELSLQRDFANTVSKEDLTKRIMLGTGEMRPRKHKNVVPHDLGSPSESPWYLTNIYNFQDVSNWKDLGPKFILQIFRDYTYLTNNDSNKELMESFLTEMYPIMINVMKSTEKFDTNNDGMIENSGFPDQTYDIWIATGVHAYCGGLWITACEAMAKSAQLLGNNTDYIYYKNLASRARSVYYKELWNGRYLNYDNSNSSHHNSIMADMMAGQWYARACNLPPVIDTEQAFSCYRTIFECNVYAFGNGKWKGAVNGMKVTPINTYKKNSSSFSSSMQSSDNNNVISDDSILLYNTVEVDSSCMQSREVWTGTTYAAAAGMIHEAIASYQSNNDPAKATASNSLSSEKCQELLQMAINTARGIHDYGWQELGYWFATPEAWEDNGHYRSLGYMRPLSIWAMQYAKESL